jgi:hypothetical protein
MLRIQVSKTKKRTAGSHVETPSILANKKCLHNIKNLDDRCVDYCLVSRFFYDTIKSKDTTNPKIYQKYLEQIKIPKDQKYPIDILKDIPEYDKLNDQNKCIRISR